MLVVSDTTPVNVLVRLEMIDVLPALFGSVLVPPAVIRELSHAHTPEVVKRWLLKPPAWLTIRQPSSAGADSWLGPGEREAIALAQEIRADYLLVDDLDARRHSVRLGLRIVGTLGVLELADLKGVAPLPVALDRLRQTDFIIAPQILDEALARWQQRQRTS